MLYTKPTSGFSSIPINGTWGKAPPTPGRSGNITSLGGCDYEVSLILNSTNFDDPDDFSWRLIVRNIRGSPTNITSRASIHDLFGNLEQEYSPFTNQTISSQRTSSRFSPNLDDGKSYLLSANITTECGDTNLENDKDQILFTIHGILTTTSSLTILSVQDLGSDKSAQFGQTIRTRINAYRGESRKESIAAWIEDDDGKRLSKESRIGVEEKFSNTTITLPIQIIPNCDEKFDDDTYTLKVEGLDADDEAEIEIEGITDSSCEEIPGAKKVTSSRAKLAFELTDIPDYFHGDSSVATLRLVNTYEEEKKVELWSYIYRGSVAYSGDREDNLQKITLPPSSSIEAELLNAPFIKEEGEYKIKFLLLEDGKKTPKEIVSDILISKYEGEQVIPTQNAQPENSETLIAQRSVAASALAMPITLFSSSAQRAYDLAPLLLIITLTLLVVILVWRR